MSRRSRVGWILSVLSMAPQLAGAGLSGAVLKPIDADGIREIRIYSLRQLPIQPGEAKRDLFHFYPILGSTTIRHSGASGLVGRLNRAMIPPIPDHCMFDARYGLTLIYEKKTVDYAISDRCTHVFEYGTGDNVKRSFSLQQPSDIPATLDGFLRKAGVPQEVIPSNHTTQPRGVNRHLKSSVGTSSQSAHSSQLLTAVDGGHYAVISASSQSGESTVKLFRADRKTPIFVADYESADGEHGAYVASAAWTTDSRFFVFIQEYGGGHSPMMHPIFFWDSHDDRLRSLDDFAGGVTGGFRLDGDVIHASQVGPDLEPQDFSVSLSSLAMHPVDWNRGEPRYWPRTGYVATARDAVAVARQAMVAFFGERIVDGQLPLKARKDDSAWIVDGSLKPGDGGRVIRAVIRATDGGIVQLLEVRSS